MDITIKNIKTKEQAREVAKDYQVWASEQSLSYGEIWEYSDKLYYLAMKFDLVKEFKENGII